MPKCSYCGKEYDLHKGLTLVTKDGSVKHLCSAKCRKNREMKRRKIRWVSKSGKEKSEK
jgi:ribosomal protein L24E